MQDNQASELIEVLAELRDAIDANNKHAMRRIELLEEANAMQRESLTLAYQNATLQAKLWAPLVEKESAERGSQGGSR